MNTNEYISHGSDLLTVFKGTMSLLTVKGSSPGQGHQMLISKIRVLPDSQEK